MPSVLDRIPGLAGYRAQEAASREAEQQQLSQFAGLVSLQGALQKQAMEKQALEREAIFRSALQAATTPAQTRDAVMRYGSPQAVQTLATQRPQAEPELAYWLRQRGTLQTEGVAGDDPRMQTVNNRINTLTTRSGGAKDPLQRLAEWRDSLPPDSPDRLLATRRMATLAPHPSKQQARDAPIQHMLVDGQPVPVKQVGGRIVHAVTEEDVTLKAVPATLGVKLEGQAGKQEMRAAFADILERQITDLEGLITAAPRRTVGPGTGPARVAEGATALFAGKAALGNFANEAEQTRQFILNLMKQVTNLGMGERSNRDAERILAALGASTWSDPQTATEALNSARALVRAARGQDRDPVRALAGQRPAPRTPLQTSSGAVIKDW